MALHPIRVTTGYLVTCDRCGKEHPDTHLSEAAALVAIEATGWKSQTVYVPVFSARVRAGEVCPVCVRALEAEYRAAGKEPA